MNKLYNYTKAQNTFTYEKKWILKWTNKKIKKKQQYGKNLLKI